jgi:hypothetical protein
MAADDFLDKIERVRTPTNRMAIFKIPTLISLRVFSTYSHSSYLVLYLFLTINDVPLDLLIPLQYGSYQRHITHGLLDSEMLMQFSVLCLLEQWLQVSLPCVVDIESGSCILRTQRSKERQH